MNQKEKALSALTAVFPDKESIAEFIKDGEDGKRLQYFIDFAARNGLLGDPSREAFEAFIEENSRPSYHASLDELTMEELIENRRKYLNIKLSAGALTKKINHLLKINNIHLPPLSSVMFTRLKRQSADTPHRRDALRGFAFWIGYERGDMGKAWHYETLKELCRDNAGKLSCNPYGIRIAFSVNSRGNIIGQDIITWVKRAIKKAFSARKELFPAGNQPKLKNYDLMTFTADLPNRDPSAAPSAYGNTLKAALDIAHQITLHWILSGFATHNRFLAVGIAAGNFDEVNNQLQAILTVKLPDDPVIRLTDYTRQCVVINQTKIILNHNPKEIELFSGEAFKVWWMTELSGMINWAFVPGIVNQKFSEEGAYNFLDLMRHLTTADEVPPPQDNDPIFYFLKFPHHPMLGFEIVRALICEKKYSESLEILKALLRVTPHHLNARIARMTIYKYLGTEALNYYTAHMMFNMAEKEAVYILENLNLVGEDFYYEYALLKLARVSTAVKALRQHDGITLETMNIRLAKPDLMTLLEQAEDIVMQGTIVSSPTIERIMHLFLLIQLLKYVVSRNIEDDGPIRPHLACSQDKIKTHMLCIFFSQHQMLLNTDNIDFNRAMQFISRLISHHDNVIAVKPYRPSNFFLLAGFYWDILPVRNVYIIRETLKLLKDAIRAAKVHVPKKEPVYSITNLSGRFVSADQFISEIDCLIKEIEKRYKKASELEMLPPDAVIGPSDDDLVLYTYHL